jgi:hypothetical protein
MKFSSPACRANLILLVFYQFNTIRWILKVPREKINIKSIPRLWGCGRSSTQYSMHFHYKHVLPLNPRRSLLYPRRASGIVCFRRKQFHFCVSVCLNTACVPSSLLFGVPDSLAGEVASGIRLIPLECRQKRRHYHYSSSVAVYTCYSFLTVSIRFCLLAPGGRVTPGKWIEFSCDH